MAQAFKPTLTTAGSQLLNQLATGGTLMVTRAQVGNGRLPDAQPIEPLTALISPKADAQLKGNEPSQNGESVIAVQYENTDLAEGFDIYELGIFARSAETSEVLYCYMTFGDKPDSVAAASTGKVLRAYDIPIVVSNQLQVDVQIDTSALATIEDVTKIVEGATPAGKVKNPLKLRQNGTGEQVFDGSEEKVFDVTKAGIGLANVDNTADASKNVLSATRLTTARTIGVNLASTTAASFNGTANITPGIYGTLGRANGGTGATNGIAAAYVQSGRFPNAVGGTYSKAAGNSAMFQNNHVPNISATIQFILFWT